MEVSKPVSRVLSSSHQVQKFFMKSMNMWKTQMGKDMKANTLRRQKQFVNNHSPVNTNWPNPKWFFNKNI